MTSWWARLPRLPRLRPVRRRPVPITPADPAPTAMPTTSMPTTSPEQVSQLLSDINTLRLSVTGDLMAAAGAMDAEAVDVAAQILDGGQDELTAFRELVAARAASLRAEHLAAVPQPRRPAGRRRRVLLALPAVPLAGALAMTSAAAFGHHSRPSQPAASVRVTPTGAAPSGNDSPYAGPTDTLRRLRSVMAHHADPTQILAVTDRLHHQLSVLISQGSSPAGAIDAGQVTEVRHLLAVEQRLLSSQHIPGIGSALSEARGLVRSLVAMSSPLTSSPQHAGHSSPPTTKPHVTPTRHATPTVPPSSSTQPSSPPTSRPTTKPTRSPTRYPFPGSTMFAGGDL